MKTMVLEYTLADSASIEDVEARIGLFVEGIRELDVGIRYASHRRRGAERSYLHMGFIPSDEALRALQAAPFFKAFAEWLPPSCIERPRVTWLDVVASTHGEP